MRRLLIDFGFGVSGACLATLLTLYFADCLELALWLGLAGGLITALIAHFAPQAAFMVAVNRHRFLTWLDGLRGRHGPLDEPQQSQLDALQRERIGYVERRLRNRVRDVDQEIRRMKRRP